MKDASQLESLMALGDYWHDQYLASERATVVALANMELFAQRIEKCRADLGLTACKPKLVLIKGEPVTEWREGG